MIDENKLKEQLFALVEQTGDERLHIDAVVYLIDDAPTVDAVPVQRCKDRIQQEIDELKENGETHSDEVRQNGLLIAEGLRMALRIVEETFLKNGDDK